MPNEHCYEPGCDGIVDWLDDQDCDWDLDGIPIRLLGVSIGTCRKCGTTGPAIPALSGLIQGIAEQIVRQPGPMTGPEARLLRGLMDLSTTALAARLGLRREWLSACENGRRRLGPQSDALIRILYLLHRHDLSERQVDAVIRAVHLPARPRVPYRIPPELLLQEARRREGAGEGAGT